VVVVVAAAAATAAVAPATVAVIKYKCKIQRFIHELTANDTSKTAKITKR